MSHHSPAMFNRFFSQKIVLAIVLFSLISAVVLIATLFYYKDIYCDGGWYSYPALALSRGGSPAENLYPLDILEKITGISSSFGHSTYRSLRVLYCAAWFKHVGKTIFAVKCLSILEFTLLICLTYMLVYRLSKNHVTTLLLSSLLLNNTRLLELAISDFRPDIMVAVMGCMCILFINLNKKIGFLLGAITAFIMLLVHITATISFLMVITFFTTTTLLASGKARIKSLFFLTGVAFFGLTVFYFKSHIMSFILFNSEMLQYHYSVLMAHQDPYIRPTLLSKILNELQNGPVYLIKKEGYRWFKYLWPHNLAEIVLIMTAATCFILKLGKPIKSHIFGISTLIALITGGVAFCLLNPHATWHHTIIFLPFIYAFMAYSFKDINIRNSPVIYILLGCICLASVDSIFYSSRQIMAGYKGGYNIMAAQEALNTITPKRDEPYYIVGPTELWPFFDPHKNIIIIDSRSKNKLYRIEPLLAQIDYILINRDFIGHNFENNFSSYFPDYEFKLIQDLSGEKVKLKIITLNPRQKYHPKYNE
jgi:hypothetical protein